MKYKIKIEKSHLNYYLDFFCIDRNIWYNDYYINLNLITSIKAFSQVNSCVKILEKKVLKYYE
jgi:hypothetical protein